MQSAFYRYWQALILATLLSFNASGSELIAHKAVYTAKIQKGVSINGEAVRELKSLGNGQWLYRFDVDSFVADIRESVRINWQNDQVIPNQYHYSLSGLFIRDRKYEVEFDWNNNLALSPIKKDRWQINDIPANTLDRLGYQLQLSMDVLLNKNEMHYQIAHKGKLRESHFQVVREEKIDTALGKVNSIVVEKVRSKDSKRQTSLWFSKQHKFLLLKMTQIESDGEKYEINIKSVEIEG